MGSAKRQRDYLWWQVPVGSAEAADVGRRMIRTTLVWFAVVLVLAVIVGVVLMIA